MFVKLINYRNSRASVFSPSRRFRDTRSTFTQYPGPGTYQADDISVSDDKVRHFVLSNFKTNGVSRMVMPYHTITPGSKGPDMTARSIKSQLGKLIYNRKYCENAVITIVCLNN
jgi:hypothetical protein